MRRIVITEIEHKGRLYTAYLVLDENRKIEELQVFEPEEDSILGRIYVGYVEKVAANIRAAFVRIDGGQKCYLPLDDLKNPVFAKKQSAAKPLCEGDMLLVQVTRDAVKTKDAVVSTKLTIHGIYCFLTTDNTRIGVSRKIDSARAEELLKLASALCADHEEKGYGLVLRTNAAGQDREVLSRDITETVQQLENILSAGIHRRPGDMVYRSMPGYLSRLKGQDTKAVDIIYTDREGLYEEIAAALPALPAAGLLKRYEDTAVSLSSLYSIGSTIDRLLCAKVWLDSGANIIIENLETLTVIDVNTGKNVSRREDVLFEVNLEAAEEIARQLRLRNLSGMIIIDFINMKSKEQQQALISHLKRELKKDHVPVTFIDITKLGLVELTRKKVYKALHEILKK